MLNICASITTYVVDSLITCRPPTSTRGFNTKARLYISQSTNYTTRVKTYYFIGCIDVTEPTIISSIKGATSSLKYGNEERLSTNDEIIVGVF